MFELLVNKLKQSVKHWFFLLQWGHLRLSCSYFPTNPNCPVDILEISVANHYMLQIHL